MTNSITLLNAVKEQKVISEDDFAKMLEPMAGPFVGLSVYIDKAEENDLQTVNTMSLAANVIKISSDVEHMLDRFHARNNRKWIWFRELTATIKNIAKAAFLLEELKQNVGAEKLLPNESDFSKKAEDITRFFINTLRVCFQELKEEGLRLNINSSNKEDLPRYRVRMRDEVILPHTIEEMDESDISGMVTRIIQRYMEVAAKISSLKNITNLESRELVKHIPTNANESKFRQLGTDLHNLQSWYDSYVFNHLIEREFPALKTLRQILFVQLNLSKIATILSHYYERHLFIPSSVTARLKKSVSSTGVLEAIFFFTLYYSIKLSEKGLEYADSLSKSLLVPDTCELPIPRKMGFHARPATKVVKVVQHYGTEVKMLVGDQSFNAGSVLELLSAGGYIVTKGYDKVIFQGDKRTLDDLRLLAEYNYGETEDGKANQLPEALSYLG
ncbi:conserved hypothetical protein [uncultured Desulfobacterium sp.]|uniref:HPr domain-containing protein n=1 Tax=uncultured Desulfobacterium sp. TaxID=201089 RepID=A0A445MXN1_9BACT|nr:conserved hypothetical protein [uncultured Desulfobacterium sp.]